MQLGIHNSLNYNELRKEKKKRGCCLSQWLFYARFLSNNTDIAIATIIATAPTPVYVITSDAVAATMGVAVGVTVGVGVAVGAGVGVGVGGCVGVGVTGVVGAGPTDMAVDADEML